MLRLHLPLLLLVLLLLHCAQCLLRLLVLAGLRCISGTCRQLLLPAVTESARLMGSHYVGRSLRNRAAQVNSVPMQPGTCLSTTMG
jgi:hypothetical protein